MSDLAITDAPALLGADTEGDDLFPIIDSSASAGSKGKSITREELGEAMLLTQALSDAIVTIVTPRTLFVTISGNDTTGNGSLAAPYATAQKAYDVALVGSGDYVIRLGVGSFAVTTTAAWPQRIGVSGVGIASVLTITTSYDVTLFGPCHCFINIAGAGLPDSSNEGPVLKLRHLVGGYARSLGGSGTIGAAGSPGDEVTPGGPGGTGGTGGTGGLIKATFCDFQEITSTGGAPGAGGPGGADGGAGGGASGDPGSAGNGGVVTLMATYAGEVECATLDYGHSVVGALTGAIGVDFGNNTTMTDPTA